MNFSAEGSFSGVGGVDAVDTRAFEHYVGTDFNGAEGGSGIGCEEGVACASGYDSHFAGFHGLDGSAVGVVVADGVHVDGREHASGLADAREG